jgi:N-acyl-D-amino-acid deacylase
MLGLGLADVDDLQPAHADQLWRVASLSKQITSAGILLLVDRGLLSLNDKVFSILTGYSPLPGAHRNPALAGITIEQLLHHAGGWNRDSEAVGDPMFNSIIISAAVGQPGPATTDMIIEYMLDKPLTYTPGTVTCYSNFGYALLGKVIETTTGMAYDDWIRANVLAPQGVTNMVLGHSLLAQRADDEVMYYAYPGQPLAASVFPPNTMVPWPYGGYYIEAMTSLGAWIASPIDQLRFTLAVDGRAPDLISPTSYAAMTANPSLPTCTTTGGQNPIDPNHWYGFGWAVNSSGNLWHDGSLPGTRTEDVIASNGYSWAVLFNSRPADDVTFLGRIDSDLWTALSGAGAFTSQDLFDQTAAFSAWMSSSDFDAALTVQQGAGRWPVRIEGRVGSNGPEHRAEFVPLHTGIRVDTGFDMDCLAYRARALANGAAGLLPAALQSYLAADGTRRYQATWAAGF